MMFPDMECEKSTARVQSFEVIECKRMGRSCFKN